MARSGKKAVADAGPLIGLARIGQLDLLDSVFEEILVPGAVSQECCRDLSLPGAQAIDHAISRERLRIVSSPGDSKIDFPPALGAGERAAIELAVASKAMVLMDDRPGRRMARRCKVPVVGTGGLFLLAKNEGLVTEIKPLIVDLQAAGYRISSTLFKELLLRAGEQ